MPGDPDVAAVDWLELPYRPAAPPALRPDDADDAAYALPSGELNRRRLVSARRAASRCSGRCKNCPRRIAATVLRYWHDFSYDEIAAATGLPESTIKHPRLHRARHMLATALGPEEQMLWDTETTA